MATLLWQPTSLLLWLWVHRLQKRPQHSHNLGNGSHGNPLSMGMCVLPLMVGPRMPISPISEIMEWSNPRKNNVNILWVGHMTMSHDTYVHVCWPLIHEAWVFPDSIDGPDPFDISYDSHMISTYTCNALPHNDLILRQLRFQVKWIPPIKSTTWGNHMMITWWYPNAVVFNYTLPTSLPPRELLVVLRWEHSGEWSKMSKKLSCTRDQGIFTRRLSWKMSLKRAY